MPSGVVYREPDSKLCQGDIISDLTHLVYKPPLVALRPFDQKRGRVHVPYEYDAQRSDDEQSDTPKQGSFQLRTPRGEQVMAFGQLGWGMVMNHDCDIDKDDSKNWLIAVIRPLDPLSTKEQDMVRGAKHTRTFYLPPYKSLPESYVDFRRITCMAQQELAQLNRVASLTQESVEDLYWHWIRFVTRRELSRKLDELGRISDQ